MKVSGIFKVIIIVVCCIVIGATVINVFLPNVVTQLSSVVEDALYKGTGMSFDFNGDGTGGNSNANNQYTDNSQGGTYTDELNVEVEGYSN